MKIIPKGVRLGLFFISILFCSFFSSGMIKAGNEENIIITEIMYDPTGNDEGREWVELYNKGAEEITIVRGRGESSWRFFDGKSNRILFQGSLVIKPGEYVILTQDPSKFKQDYPDFLGSIIQVSAMELRNTSSTIALRIGSQGKLWSQVSYGQSSGANGNGKSLERKGLSEVFLESLIEKGTPGKENSINLTQNSPVFSPASSQPTSTPSFQIFPSDVVINEFVPDPIDGEEEWVELYNNTDKEIDLTGFYIEEGSGAQTFLSGKILPKNFFVVEKIKGYLNNSGDMIFLKDSAGKTIDKVAYGEWNDGNLNDNAPTAKDPRSVARIVNGKDTDNDYLDFKIANPTKGTPNQVLNSENFVSGIVINEMLPNPKGDDSENEFIELKNLNNFDVDLENWYLQDSSNRKFVISSKKVLTKIPKNGFLVIFRKSSKIALNNSGGDCIKLFQPDGTLADSVCYSEGALEGIGFAKNNEGTFEWTEILTPGKENEIKKPNQKPVAKISVEKEKISVGEEIFFDGSDSFDPDGDNLKFFWDFGDEKKKEGVYVSHGFSKPKKYKVALRVEDEKGFFDETNVRIEVLKKEEETFSETDLLGKLFISEIFPNPKGKDDQEFIEIFNSSHEEIDISNFILTDRTKKFYRIKEGTKIGAQGFLVFWKKETEISLNNDEGEMKLLDPDKNLIDRIFYTKALEGFSLARNDNGEMAWTKIVTPGKKNEFSKEEKKAEAEKEKTEASVKEMELKEIKKINPEGLVKTKGIVSAPPKIFGENIFYLSGSGVKVRLNFKDIPELKIGDEVEILGKVLEEEGEKGLEVFSKNDIKVLGFRSVPLPKELKIEGIDESLLSSLIKIRGEITEIKRNFTWLKDEGEEILVILKNCIRSNGNFEKGDFLRVAGILKKIGNQFAIFPRQSEDLELIKKANLESFAGRNFLQKKNLTLMVVLMTILIFVGIFLLKKREFLKF